MAKRKKITTITFSRETVPAAKRLTATATAGPSAVAGPSGTTHVLRENTSIRQDGLVHQDRSVVTVAAGDKQPVAKVHADVRQEQAREPIYEPYTAGDHGGDDDDDDDEKARELRDSDDPLRQWVDDFCDIFVAELLRHEGHSEHAPHSLCSRCKSGKADHCCNNCLNSGELFCMSCVIAAHQQMPFHKIQEWTGSTFKTKTLKKMGLHIQLGHWHGPTHVCSVLLSAADFVIVDNHGVHKVALDFCDCGQGGSHIVQLLCAQLWPATTMNPRTAATFSVLRRYHLLLFQVEMPDKDRYHEFLRMTREWRHIALGECALLCPACLQPGKNMAPDWMDAPEDKQFLHALFLALDVNFCLKRKDVSSEEKDPGLGNRWAFYCEVNKYMRHVRNWNKKQDSHCVAYDAVDKPNREARGTASSGIGAVNCARHNMKRPNAVGDLQLEEQYMDMDYMFFWSIVGSPLLQFFVSYNIACQWHLNIWTRMVEYQDATITIDGKGKFMTFLVPEFHLPAHIKACNLKFSFHLTCDVGQTDGEALERGWADANPLARSTKEMGPGFRRDTLDDHFNDWNQKDHSTGKVEKAIPEMVTTRQALADLNEFLGPEPVNEWTDMAVLWEDDDSKPNPFETIRKDQHVAKVRAELAAEAAEKETAGNEDATSVKGEMHITELIAMGLQLEDQQRILAFDVVGTGLHPTDAAVQDLRVDRRPSQVLPGVKNVWECEDEAHARAAEDAPGPDADKVVLKKIVLEHEYRLPVGQTSEALHEVRRLLLVQTHLYKLKDTHTGASARTLGGGAVLRCARGISDAGRVLKGGMGFHDPDRKKKKTKQARKVKQPLRAMSWIWVNRGEHWAPGDDVAMNKAVRIEWARHVHASALAEEVDFLEEEMARITQFLRWQSNWWLEREDVRGLAEGPQRKARHSLPDLIWQGRMGESLDVGGADDSEEEDSEGDDSGEEDEAILTLPHRPVKSTPVFSYFHISHEDQDRRAKGDDTSRSRQAWGQSHHRSPERIEYPSEHTDIANSSNLFIDGSDSELESDFPSLCRTSNRSLQLEGLDHCRMDLRYPPPTTTTPPAATNIIPAATLSVAPIPLTPCRDLPLPPTPAMPFGPTAIQNTIFGAIPTFRSAGGLPAHASSAHTAPSTSAAHASSSTRPSGSFQSSSLHTLFADDYYASSTAALESSNEFGNYRERTPRSVPSKPRSVVAYLPLIVPLTALGSGASSIIEAILWR
ncbi:hypothetical protein B0H19DRAFT_1383787 [Mycena capillaripes]|nr:hypothetical protein B0H19DRAFT_1383787 [Mycena capillaripes]